MPEWAKYAATAACGGAAALAGAYVWLIWYLNRNNPM